MSNWKARIGHLSPSVFEIPSDWSVILPPGFTLVSTGLNVRAHTPQEFDRAIESLESSLSVFVAEEVDCILLAGITVAVQRGYRAEEELAARLTERFGLPVTTSLSANAEALKQVGAKKIVVATAYLERINQALKRYFEDAGFEVLGIRGLGVSDPVGQAKLPAEASYEVAHGVFGEHSEADAILVHGRWHSLAHVEKLEGETGRPVVSSVAASLWWVLKSLKIKLPLEGFGRILRQ
jgi:maleate cis-trans isomerase